MKLAPVLLILIIFTPSCVSVSGDLQEQEVNRQLPPQELAMTGIQKGGKTLQQVIAIVREKKLHKAVSDQVEVVLRKDISSLKPSQILSACQLYRATTKNFDYKILSRLIRHPHKKVRQYGWLLTGINPSNQMANFIEREASVAIVKDREANLLVPEFAATVRKNQISSLFSLLRIGLLSDGGDEFAKAMADLNPSLAAAPFFDYLGKAELQDLRQINQSQVDPYTCLVIMRYFAVNALPISHPKLSHLFLYAVSRNPALSEMAKTVLDFQIPRAKEHLVYSLATLPIEVQIAFIEGTRRNPTANFKILLTELKKTTRFEQVVEEIDAIKIF